jgi:hypothetical protein
VKEPGSLAVAIGRDALNVRMLLPLAPLENAVPEEVEKPPVRSV